VRLDYKTLSIKPKTNSTTIGIDHWNLELNGQHVGSWHLQCLALLNCLANLGSEFICYQNQTFPTLTAIEFPLRNHFWRAYLHKQFFFIQSHTNDNLLLVYEPLLLYVII